MEIRARYTTDKKYVEQAYRRLYAQRLRQMVRWGIFAIAVGLFWLLMGLPKILALVGIGAGAGMMVPTLCLPAVTWKRTRKEKNDGEKELYIGEQGLRLKNLKYDTERFYPPAQIGGVMQRGGAFFLLLPGKRCLMLLPEYVQEGDEEIFLRYIQTLAPEDPYDRKSVACQSYAAEKLSAKMDGRDSMWNFFVVFYTLFGVLCCVLLRDLYYAGLYMPCLVSLVTGLTETILCLLRRTVRRRSLEGRAQILHDLCLLKYRGGFFRHRDRRLLTMALCCLTMGQQRRAKLALEKIDPKKLPEKRQALYHSALRLPGHEEAQTLLKESRRLDRKKDRVKTAVLMAILAALFLLLLITAKNTPFPAKILSLSF